MAVDERRRNQTPARIDYPLRPGIDARFHRHDASVTAGNVQRPTPIGQHRVPDEKIECHSGPFGRLGKVGDRSAAGPAWCLPARKSASRPDDGPEPEPVMYFQNQYPPNKYKFHHSDETVEGNIILKPINIRME
jgi:hypothetical protein